MRADRYAEEGLQLLDPFSCRMWDCHDRLPEFINEDSCRDVIRSFLKEGQKHPVLARRAEPQCNIRYELIYGARRLFAAQHLNQELVARVRQLDNAHAFIEMDIENRLRRDISPYERGTSFKAWLRDGHFSSQEEISRALGLSAAKVCRLMKFSELPTALVTAFADARQIRESWAVALAERCVDLAGKEQMLAVARTIGRERKGRVLDAPATFRLLLNSDRRSSTHRVAGRDDIVRSTDGHALFRVSYRHSDLHIIIPRRLVSNEAMNRVTAAVQSALEPNGRSAEEPALEARPLRHASA